MDARPLDPAEFLRHEGWLRGLALRLVQDEARADDLVQETWRRAIERPPRDPRALPAWLARVLRNTAYESNRSEGRRRARERRAGCPRDVEPTSDVVARTELHRQLVDALLGLEEPYRQTLLLKYFDGLSSREIAAQQGVAQATVRTRARRGLDRLRLRLDVAHGGDRRGWALALVPLAASPPATTGTLATVGGMLAMKLTMKAVGIGLFLLLLAGTGVHLATRDVGREETSPLEATDDSRSAPGAAISIEAARLGGVDAPATQMAPAGKARITGLVLDAQGIPAAGVLVEARVERDRIGWGDLLRLPPVTDDRRERDPLLTTRSGADGRFTLDGLPEGERIWVVARPAAPRYGSHTVVQASAGRSPYAQLVVGVGIGLRGRVVDADGTPLAAWIDIHSPHDDGGAGYGAGSFSIQAVATDAKGRFQVAAVPPGTLWLHARAPSQAARSFHVVEAREGEEILVRLGEEKGCRVEGHVTDSAGKGLGGVAVVVAASAGRIGQGFQEMVYRAVATRSDGYYRIDHLPPGRTQQIRAEAEGYLPTPMFTGHQIGIDERRPRRFDIVLLRAGAVTGRVVDREGRGLAGVQLYANLVSAPVEGLAPPEQPRAVADGDGRYRMDGVVPRPMRVFPRGAQAYEGPGVSVRVEEGKTASAPDLVLAARPEPAEGPATPSVPRPSGSVDGQVVGPDGAPLPGVWVVAVGEDGKQASTQARAFGRFHVGGLAAGRWQLEPRAQLHAGERIGGTVEVQVSEDGEADDVTLRVAEVYELAGSVVDRETGAPIAHASLHAWPVRVDRADHAARVSTRTDSDGRFALRIYRGGDWAFEVWGSTCEETGTAGDTGLELRVRPKWGQAVPIEVRVLDEAGDVVPRARVQVIERSAGGGSSSAVIPGVGGVFCRDLHVRGDTIHIRVEQPADALARPLNLQGRLVEGLDPAGSPFEVVLRPGRALDVRVLDEEGEPLAGAGLHASSRAFGGEGIAFGTLGARSPFVTDAEGRCRVVGLPPRGIVELRADVEPPALAPAAVELSPGATSVTLRCLPTAPIAGRVVRHGGDSAGGVHVRLRRGEGPGGEVVVMTDAEGRFRFDAVEAGTKPVIKVYENAASHVSQRVSAGNEAVVLTLPAAGHIEGRVRGDGWLAHALEIVLDRAGDAWPSRVADQRVGRDGTFRLPNVPPGRYRLQVTSRGVPLGEALTVESPVSDFVVELPVLRLLDVRVNGGEGARFHLWYRKTGQEGWSSTGLLPTKRFVLPCADDAPRDVVVAKDGDTRIAAIMAVRPSGGAVALTLAEGAEIRGRIAKYDAERDRHARIEARCAGLVRLAEVDTNGRFRIGGLLPGSADVWVGLAGARTPVLRGVETGTTDLVLREPPR